MSCNDCPGSDLCCDRTIDLVGVLYAASLDVEVSEWPACCH